MIAKTKIAASIKNAETNMECIGNSMRGNETHENIGFFTNPSGCGGGTFGLLNI
ncbi:MAG: hypothetical protein U9R23_00965 [Candidatus Cloacimonadota bacterium]|nr:hypothetical protein [Candidatus Cloacimonadota bacterium]